MQKNNCEGCVHYRRLSGGDPLLICHYMLDNGHCRGGTTQDCMVKKTKGKSLKERRRDGLSWATAKMGEKT